MPKIDISFEGDMDKSDTSYLVRLPDGTELGPASLDDLRAWAAAGVIERTTSVQVVGTETRIPAATVLGIFSSSASSSEAILEEAEEAEDVDDEREIQVVEASHGSTGTTLTTDSVQARLGQATSENRQPSIGPSLPSPSLKKPRQPNRWIGPVVLAGLGLVVIGGVLTLLPKGEPKKSDDDKATVAVWLVKSLADATAMYQGDWDDCFPPVASHSDFSPYEFALPYLKEDVSNALMVRSSEFVFNWNLTGMPSTSLDEPARTGMWAEGACPPVTFPYSGKTPIAKTDGSVKMFSPEEVSGLVWKPSNPYLGSDAAHNRQQETDRMWNPND
ncbi:MAG: hypothetical protein K1X67_07220 [Fimbriimonadaceae bacterium]|nr:hypothetical protein [Fimbriimonadaceae bacterium]